MKRERDTEDKNREFIQAFSCVSGVMPEKIKRWEHIFKDFKGLVMEIERFKTAFKKNFSSYTDEEKTEVLVFPLYVYLMGFDMKTRAFIIKRLVRDWQTEEEDHERNMQITDDLKKFVSEDDINDYVKDLLGDIDGIRKESEED